MPRRKLAGPAEASEPRFEPQWAIREMEGVELAEEYGIDLEEMRDMDAATIDCRLCACTEYSPCDEPFGPCWWVEGDLCSSCEELMRIWPQLRLADGHGIAASWAFAPEVPDHATRLGRS